MRAAAHCGATTYQTAAAVIVVDESGGKSGPLKLCILCCTAVCAHCVLPTMMAFLPDGQLATTTTTTKAISQEAGAICQPTFFLYWYFGWLVGWLVISAAHSLTVGTSAQKILSATLLSLLLWLLLLSTGTR